MEELKLAVTWNRVDIARNELLVEDTIWEVLYLGGGGVVNRSVFVPSKQLTERHMLSAEQRPGDLHDRRPGERQAAVRPSVHRERTERTRVPDTRTPGEALQLHL